MFYAVIAVVIALLLSNKQSTAPVSVDDLFKEAGEKYDVDPVLIKAVASVESSLDPRAYNPADPSYGLMQVLCKPDGNGGCSNVFNIDSWPPESAEELYDPSINIGYGAQILAHNIKTYGFRKGIAVYNSWSARHDPDNGPFVNQDYVDKVLAKFYSFGGIDPWLYSTSGSYLSK